MLCNNRKKEATFAHSLRKFHSETAVVYNMRVRAHFLEMISYTSYLYYYIFALVFLGLYFGNFIFLFFVLIFPRPNPKVKFLEKIICIKFLENKLLPISWNSKIALVFSSLQQTQFILSKQLNNSFFYILIHNTCVHFQPPGLFTFKIL